MDIEKESTIPSTSINAVSENEENDNILEKMKTFKLNYNFPSIKTLIDKYDEENISKKTSNDISKIISYNMSLTPEKEQDFYSELILNKIKTIKKSNVVMDLPKLPYGKGLSDSEFINLFEKCVDYANYKLDPDQLEKLKQRLLNLEYFIKNVFGLPKILKDLKENALLTLLVTNDNKEQMDNFNLLKVEYSSISPLVEMNFNNSVLNKKELVETFTSYVYIKRYMKVLDKFISDFRKKVPNETKLKDYISNYFNKHEIYFAYLPDNIMAVSIHTGNMYIKSKYIYEYYTEKDKDAQLIIREKIILNIAHELNHVLIREISDIMKENYLLKSKIKDKKLKYKELKFVNKFDNNFHILSIEESGNLFDYYFYNQYYFDDLYNKEAELFFNIKDIKTLSEYKDKLNNIIDEEKKINIDCDLINKFKRLKQEPSRCIKSKILGIEKIEDSNRTKLYDEDDE